MDEFARIGWNVRRLRRRRGVTQEVLAADSGLDRGYVSGVERGVRNPSVKQLARMAHALDADISELFDLDEAESFAAATGQAHDTTAL